MPTSNCKLILSLLLLVATLPTGHAQQPTARIINGTPAPRGAWPWMVSLSLMEGQAARAHFCGGALIDARYVLTAAHCVMDYESAPGSIRAVVGATRLSVEEGVSVGIEGVILHPAFSPETMQNDVALLRLAAPVSLATVPVVVPGEEALWTAGTLATLTGWGVLDSVFPARPDDLQQGTFPIVSDGECRGTIGLDFDPSSMLCAGKLASSPVSDDGIDACFGDSGGPLMVPTPEGGWKIAGVVSWGFNCGDYKFWGVYARVASFASWINSLPGVRPFAKEGVIIDGQPTVGTELHCLPGEWGGDQSITFSYEWLDEAGEPLEGANLPEYRIGRRDLGSRLICRVTASNAAGSRVVETEPYGPIFPRTALRLTKRASKQIDSLNVLCSGRRCQLLVQTRSTEVASVDALLLKDSCAPGKRCDVKASWNPGTKLGSGLYVLPFVKGRRGSYTIYFRLEHEDGSNEQPVAVKLSFR